MSFNDIVLLAITGILAGFISGSLGVGGGIIIIPALIFVFGLTQHQAQGTSLAILSFPIGIIAATTYYKRGYVNIKYALIILAAFLIGSYLGAIFSVNLPAKTLKKMFGVLMLIAGTKMILGK
jgi:uncharacterized protein